MATERYATPTESIALFNRRNGLGLQGRFMVITGAGLLAIVLCVIALVGWFETGKLEGTLRAASESELLSLLSTGMTNRELGTHLYISENTVKTQLRHLYAKLSVRNRAQAAALAADGFLGEHRRQTKLVD